MNEYILYTDRKENFSCDIALEGAALNESFARIILETNNINYVFNGKIDTTGKCEIPIRPLKGLMEIRDTGKMVLEVVADDTYFKPWESDFTVDASTKLEVKINEQTQPTKPKISVSINAKKAPQTKSTPKPTPKPTPVKLTLAEAVGDVKTLLNKKGVNKKNLKNKKKTISKIFTEYFTKKKISNKKHKNKILKMVVESMIKG